MSVERIRGEIHLAGYFNCHPEINRQSRAIVLISSLCVIMNHFALGDPQPRHPGENAVTLKPFQSVDLNTVQTAWDSMQSQADLHIWFPQGVQDLHLLRDLVPRPGGVRDPARVVRVYLKPTLLQQVNMAFNINHATLILFFLCPQGPTCHCIWRYIGILSICLLSRISVISRTEKVKWRFIFCRPAG